MTQEVTVGVLALQGAFHEHIVLLEQASRSPAVEALGASWTFTEIRTSEELSKCDALIIPGGESTTMALVASRSDLMEPLRHFVKAERRPTWGTCAGMILLAEAANRTKKGGQELIGGLDVRVERNHFGRQTESFEADLDLDFLPGSSSDNAQASPTKPFKGVFIRAPIVQRILPQMQGEQAREGQIEGTVVAPSKAPLQDDAATQEQQVQRPVRVRGLLTRKSTAIAADRQGGDAAADGDATKIVAVQQWNVFGTSFHPELTRDSRIHEWWLQEILPVVKARREA